MILGIGFIMVAAIFPVAIQQTYTASDESVSASVAWNAINVIQAKFAESELPPVGAPAPFQKNFTPGVVRSFRDPQARGVASLTRGQAVGIGRPKDPTGKGGDPNDPRNQVDFAQPPDYLWNRIKGESVVVDDRRFAWVGFYRRHFLPGTSGDAAPYAQVVVVVARARENPAYGARDITDRSLANLQPRYVRFDLTSDGDGPKVDQEVNFIKGDKDAVTEGAYLIVAHDAVKGFAQGTMNCNVFRVGNHLGGTTWELSPEAEFAPHSVTENVYGKLVRTSVNGLSDAEGYVIGRTKVGNGYEGVAQDVAVYTMIIPVQ